MPCRLRRSWSKNTFNRSQATLLIGLLTLSAPLLSFPDKERISTTLSEPPLTAVSSQASQMVLDGDEFLYVIFGDSIERVDLGKWALSGEEIPDLVDLSDEENGEDLTGDVTGIAIRGDFFYAAQTDGDLIVVDLNDITATPDSIDLGESTFGAVVADPETGSDDDKLYILDKTKNSVEVFDISEGKITSSIPLKDTQGTAVAPRALALVNFPTASSSSSVDKLYVASDRGLVFMISEGAASTSTTITLSSTNKELAILAPTPGGNFLLVGNTTDDTVHVINTATDAEVDTVSSQSGVNPIEISPNDGLRSIVVTEVADPDDTYAYVTGSDGVTVVDLDMATSSFDGFSLIDFNDKGSGDSEDEPMTLSAIGGPIVASTTGDFLLTSNADASLSVISDNPFASIQSTSLGDGPLTVGGSFTVTFQSDEAGTYEIRAGGDRTGSGTLLGSGTVDAADTDVTTAEVSYDASLFSEGRNRLFVLVTDASGHRGHDAVDIKVDTPPSSLEITEVGFGNEKVFVTFKRLNLEDMDLYRIYVDTSSDVVAAKAEVAGSITQPSSGDTVTARVSGLANGQLYFVGVEAVDKSGNVGPRATRLTTGALASATPEVTAGLAGILGEGGCSLLQRY